MIKAVVFDLDHTLFDRYGTINEIAPEICKAFDLNDGITVEVFTRELCYADKQFVHKGWQFIHKYLVEKNVFKMVPTYDFYATTVFEKFKTKTVKYSFAIPVLKELKSMGLKTGLITNGESALQRFKIKNLDLDGLFDEVIISGETPYAKPQKEIFHLMSQRLGIEPSEMVYAGDHPLNDVYGSRNAGCVPIWVKTTGTWVFPEIEEPELQVETVEEIPQLVSILNRG